MTSVARQDSPPTGALGALPPCQTRETVDAVATCLRNLFWQRGMEIRLGLALEWAESLTRTVIAHAGPEAPCRKHS